MQRIIECWSSKMTERWDVRNPVLSLVGEEMNQLLINSIKYVHTSYLSVADYFNSCVSRTRFYNAGSGREQCTGATRRLSAVTRCRLRARCRDYVSIDGESMRRESCLKSHGPVASRRQQCRTIRRCITHVSARAWSFGRESKTRGEDFGTVDLPENRGFIFTRRHAKDRSPRRKFTAVGQMYSLI